MAGSCWRLLAAFSLIFVVVASVLLRGQNVAADRSPALTSVPVLGSSLPPLRYSPPLAPVRIPFSPNLPVRFPIAPNPIVPGEPIFQQLVRAAGIIFSGRVTSIGRNASPPGPGRASTTVTFVVERALRGASHGQNLTIHEWASLWTGGERYRVGERVLLFLYSPGKFGLTSPVAGAMGRFRMDSQGKIVMSAMHAAALRADPILGGKAVVSYADFALAVRRSHREE